MTRHPSDPRRTSRLAMLVLFTACALAGAASPGSAFVAREWANTAGGAANVPSNWYPATIPGADDDAYFDKPGPYAVTWAGPRDSLYILEILTSGVGFSMSGSLGISNSLKIEDAASLTISSGTLLVAQMGTFHKVAGTLTVDGPNSALEFDSPGLFFVCEGGPAAAGILNVTNGATVRAHVPLALGNDIGLHEYLTLAHRTGSKFTGFHYPTVTTYGLPGNPGIDLGGAGTFVGDVYDGGTMWSGGDLTMGYTHGGIGNLHVGLQAGGVYSGVLVGGQTWIGGNAAAFTDGGIGSLSIGNGYGTFEGRCWLGDPDDSLRAGDFWPRGAISAGTGAHLLFASGLTMSKYLSGELDLNGGNTQIIGGTSDIRQHVPFEVGGLLAPELWLEGGSTTHVWPGDGPRPALAIGRQGPGTLRVVGAGTTLTVHGAMTMADSSAGTAYLTADSSASVSVLGPLSIPAVASTAAVTVSGASTLAVQDSLLMGVGNGSADAHIDSLSMLTVGGSTRIGLSSSAGLFVSKGSHATLTGLTIGPADGNLEAGYGGARVDVSGRFDVTGAAHALVDSGGVIAYAGGTRAMSVGEGGAHVYVDRSGLLQVAPQLDVRGGLTLTPFIGDLMTNATTVRLARAPGARPAAIQSPVPGTTARIECPLTRLLGNGALDGIGTLAGRLRIDSGTATFIAGTGGSPYTGRTVVGDSTRSDGFYSIGQTTILGGDTLTTLDLDGADLGKVLIEGGVLQLPKSGHLRAGFRLDGAGTVLGSLDVRDSAWVSFTGSVTGDLALTGTLDLNNTASFPTLAAPDAAQLTRTLSIGTLHASGAGRVTLRIGPTDQDQIAVTGVATLGGTLDVRTFAGQSPTVGTLFTVLTASSVSGTFANVTLNGRPTGGAISVLYGSSNVRVVVLAPITTGVDDGGVTTPGIPSTLRFAGAGAPRDAALALDLPAAAMVRVAVYDVTGRQVGVLVDAALSAGRYRYELASVVSGSGMYFARAEVVVDERRRVLTTRAVVLR